jgi:hypothetical protein
MTANLHRNLFMFPLKKIELLRHKLPLMKMAFTLFAPSKLLKTLWLPVFVLGSVSVSAQTAIGSINLPSTPAFPQGQDRIRGADGTECSRSTAPRSKWAEIGVVGTGVGGQGVENSYPFVGYNGTIPSAQPYSRAGGAVYGRIIINLDAKQTDLDCNYLYTLELERLKAELEQAKLIGAGKPVAK